MNIKMQLLDSYITKYEFFVNDKLNNCPGIMIDGSVNAEEIYREKKENGILIKWKQENNIILMDEKNNDLGKINMITIGVFLFDFELSNEEIEKILSINCNAILYQQARATINANTALTNSIPNIIIPVINFAIPEDKTNVESNEDVEE